METNDKTVEQACEVLYVYPKAEVCDGSGLTVLNNDVIADLILAAHKRELAEKDAEIAELRECLREAVEWSCGNPDEACEDCVAHGGDTPCKCEKWRKTLEGGAAVEISSLRALIKEIADAASENMKAQCGHCDLRDACQEGEDGTVVPCNQVIKLREALKKAREVAK